MFFATVLAALSLASIASARPVANKARTFHDVNFNTDFDFENWQGHNFFGHGNFDGSHNQRILVAEPHRQVVCRTQSTHIIQQRLAILAETYKRIITEQVCEVELQTVLHEQFHGFTRGFRFQLGHHEGSFPGFDGRIAGKWSELFSHDGLLTTHDLGFTGIEIGREFIAPSGHNWHIETSPASHWRAFVTSRHSVEKTSLFPVHETFTIDQPSIFTHGQVTNFWPGGVFAHHGGFFNVGFNNGHHEKVNVITLGHGGHGGFAVPSAIPFDGIVTDVFPTSTIDFAAATATPSATETAEAAIETADAEVAEQQTDPALDPAADAAVAAAETVDAAAAPEADPATAA